MIAKTILFALLVATCSLSGCGSSNNDTDEINYSGIWDLRYNFSLDDCGIAIAGVPGFVDQQTILQEGNTVSLSATSQLITGAVGELRNDSSFEVAESSTADIFGNGSQCNLKTRVAYENLQGQTAESLFIQQIDCSDGYSCETRAVGQAKRQPAN